MRKLILCVVMLVVGVLLLAGRGERSEMTAEREKVRSVLKKYVEALEAENVKELARLFVEDDDMTTVNIAVPGISRGPKKLIDTASRWFSGVKDIEVKVRNEIIKINSACTAAWVTFILDGGHLPLSGQDRFAFKGMRVTWGLEKREGKYLIVQGHWSFVLKD